MARRNIGKDFLRHEAATQNRTNNPQFAYKFVGLLHKR